MTHLVDGEDGQQGQGEHEALRQLRGVPKGVPSGQIGSRDQRREKCQDEQQDLDPHRHFLLHFSPPDYMIKEDGGLVLAMKLITPAAEGEDVLLHICCAPDASYAVPAMQERYRIIGFFFNPYPAKREHASPPSERGSLGFSLCPRGCGGGEKNDGGRTGTEESLKGAGARSASGCV
jgi:hypothetical protein